MKNSNLRIRLTKYILIPVILLYFIVIVVIMSLLIVASVLVSDFCQAPDETLSNVIGIEAGTFVLAFTTCDVASSVIKFAVQ
eukprot:Awhi_evm1s748